MLGGKTDAEFDGSQLKPMALDETSAPVACNGGARLQEGDHVRTAVLAAFVAAAAVLIGGCSASPGSVAQSKAAVSLPPASLVSTGTMPGGSVKASSSNNGLQISAEVSSTQLVTRRGIAVHLVLENVGSKSVSWSDFEIGCSATTVGVRGTQAESAGLGYGPLGKTPRPAALASGESTTVVQVLPDPEPGIYLVSGSFRGEGGPKGTTPEIVVRVKKAP